MRANPIPLIFLLFSNCVMANNLKCSNQKLFNALMQEYRSTGNIETKSFSPLNPEMATRISQSDAEVCTIHDRSSDIVHSYSIFLYIKKAPSESFLIFEGGFGGADVIGFGPIETKTNKQPGK